MDSTPRPATTSWPVVTTCSTSACTLLEEMAKPAAAALAVALEDTANPTTWPARLTSGPPLLPPSMAASVAIASE